MSSSSAFAAAERRLRRKLDRRVVLLLSILYMLAFLNRSNIGSAKIAGMQDDLHLSDPQFQWLLTIFYISYAAFSFLAIMWKLVPPHVWAATCVFLWGSISALQAGMHSWAGMMALRSIMGVAEAGYTGVPYLLSFFYLRHELGLRIGIFISAAPLANTFAGALAYGVTSGKFTLPKWRILFLIEGLPVVVAAVAVWFLLPDSPDQAKFLSEEEKAVARARGTRQVGAGTRIGSVKWSELFAGLADPKGWVMGLMQFSGNIAFASLSAFLPSILLEMGFTAVHAQGLTVPPFFLSFLMTIATTHIADRTQQRGFTIAVLAAMGGVGYAILAKARSVGVRYFGVFLAASGIFPAIANVMPWATNNQGSDTRRGAAIAMLNLVGQCGPLLGSHLYSDAEKPYFVKGQSVCAAFMFFFCFLALVLRKIYVWENKKLDRKYGTLVEQRRAMEEAALRGQVESEVGLENYGPQYRYVL